MWGSVEMWVECKDEIGQIRRRLVDGGDIRHDCSI
jgi:hypothetical protein